MIITIDTEKANLTSKQIRQIHEIIIGEPNYCTCPKPTPSLFPVFPVWNECAKCRKPIKPKEKWCSCEKPIFAYNGFVLDPICQRCRLPLKGVLKPKSPPY